MPIIVRRLNLFPLNLESSGRSSSRLGAFRDDSIMVATLSASALVKRIPPKVLRVFSPLTHTHSNTLTHSHDICCYFLLLYTTPTSKGVGEAPWPTSQPRTTRLSVMWYCNPNMRRNLSPRPAIVSSQVAFGSTFRVCVGVCMFFSSHFSRLFTYTRDAHTHTLTEQDERARPSQHMLTARFSREQSFSTGNARWFALNLSLRRDALVFAKCLQNHTGVRDRWQTSTGWFCEVSGIQEH